jgi:hypothetical protein
MRRITSPPLSPSADDTVFLPLDAVAVLGPDDRKTVAAQADLIAEIARVAKWITNCAQCSASERSRQHEPADQQALTLRHLHPQVDRA